MKTLFIIGVWINLSINEHEPNVAKYTYTGYSICNVYCTMTQKHSTQIVKWTLHVFKEFSVV